MSDQICPVPECETPRPREHLLCRRHWELVPSSSQTVLALAAARMPDGHRGEIAETASKAAQLAEGLYWDPGLERWLADDLTRIKGWEVLTIERVTSRLRRIHLRRLHDDLPRTAYLVG